MKKLSLVLAAALLLGGISFAQTGTTTKAPAAKSTKKGEMKGTKKASSKKASKTKTATPAAK